MNWPLLFAVVLGNGTCLWGVLFRGWAAWDLLLLIWLELALVVVFCIVRMLAADPRNRGLWFLKALWVPIIAVVLSALCAGVLLMIHWVFRWLEPPVPVEFYKSVFHLAPYVFVEHQLWPGLAALAASHAFWFFWIYLRTGQFRSPFFILQAARFLERMCLLVAALWIAGLVSNPEFSPIWTITAFMLAKTLFDYYAGAREQSGVGRASS